MEELTPEQKALQEAIRSKVDTLKFIRTHVRLAGIVIQVVGMFAHSTAVSVLGLFVFAASYAYSVSIMEDINILVWGRPDEPKKEDETTED